MSLDSALAFAAILISIALVGIILLQIKGEGVGGLQSGSFVRTRRGMEKSIFQFTIFLSAVWISVSAVAVWVR